MHSLEEKGSRHIVFKSTEEQDLYIEIYRAYSDFAKKIESNFMAFDALPEPYSLTLIDEAQDFSPTQLENLLQQILDLTVVIWLNQFFTE